MRSIIKGAADEFSETTPMEDIRKALIKMAVSHGNDKGKSETHVNKVLEVAAKDKAKRLELISQLNKWQKSEDDRENELKTKALSKKLEEEGLTAEEKK